MVCVLLIHKLDMSNFSIVPNEHQVIFIPHIILCLLIFQLVYESILNVFFNEITYVWILSFLNIF